MLEQPCPSPLIADFLADASGLGRVRAMLRNCSGMVEMFCSSESFLLTPHWLTVRTPVAHLHVQVATLCTAQLKDERADAHLQRQSIWFHGRCGSPCLILILDQTEGDERLRQEAAFEDLRQRYGERVTFGERPAVTTTVH